MKKWILIAVAAVVVIGGSVGYYLFEKKVPTLDDAKPDFTVTANEIFDEFEEDEDASTKKYDGKVILVKGEIAEIKDVEGKLCIILLAENSMIGGGVNCSFRSENSTTHQVGDEVEIKGWGQGYLMDVILNNCSFN